MPAHPFSLSNICLLLISAGLIAYLFFLWRIVNQKTPPGNLKAAQKPIARFATVYAVYFILLCLLASQGFFLVTTMPPRALLIFLPLVLSVVLLSTAKTSGALQFLAAIPPAALILIQSFRIFIELLFLQFLKEGLLPVVLSFHGRNYDLLIGVVALPVSCLFLKKSALARRAGVVFNILGLLSLINIFFIVILSLPTPSRVYDTLYLPAYFPGVMIVFAASLAIYLHILSLKQLLAVWPTQAKDARSGNKEAVSESRLA